MELIVTPNDVKHFMWNICDISYVKHNGGVNACMILVDGTPDDPPEDYIENLFFVGYDGGRYITFHDNNMYILDMYSDVVMSGDAFVRDRQLHDLIQSGMEPYQAFGVMAL